MDDLSVKDTLQSTFPIGQYILNLQEEDNLPTKDIYPLIGGSTVLVFQGKRLAPLSPWKQSQEYLEAEHACEEGEEYRHPKQSIHHERTSPQPLNQEHLGVKGQAQS